MPAANLKAAAPRRRPAMSAATPWSILPWLVIFFAVLSGCAGTRQPIPAATPPKIGLSEAQKTGAGCNQGMDGLRGRLPPPGRLPITEALALGVDAEARAACWRRGYFELVGVAEASDRAWERFADGEPQPVE